MIRYCPRVDFAFRKLFGTPENNELLKALINAVLPKSEQIAEVELLNPYNTPDHVREKESILDVKAKDKTGRLYNIEMQIADQMYYERRALYYWSRLYGTQLSKGQGFSRLNKTIGIHILNFNCLDEAAYHNVFKIVNMQSKQCYFDDFELHFIELNKFETPLVHISTALERWVTFLKLAEIYKSDDLPDPLQSDKTIVQAMSALERMYMNEAEYACYEGQFKWLLDKEGAIETSKQRGVEEGMQKGIEEGMQKGMEAGIQKGLEKVVKNALATGTDVATIAKITGLSAAQITAMQEKA